jgi:hypothetical protein
VAPALTLQETGNQNTQHPRLYDVVLDSGFGVVAGHFTALLGNSICFGCRIPVNPGNGIRWAHSLRRPGIEVAVIDETPYCVCCASARLIDARSTIASGRDSQTWKRHTLKRPRQCTTCRQTVKTGSQALVLETLINVGKPVNGARKILGTIKELTFCAPCATRNVDAWQERLDALGHDACAHCQVRCTGAPKGTQMAWPDPMCRTNGLNIQEKAAVARGTIYRGAHQHAEDCPEGANSHRLGVCATDYGTTFTFAVATSPTSLHVEVKCRDHPQHAGLAAVRQQLLAAAQAQLKGGPA